MRKHAQQGPQAAYRRRPPDALQALNSGLLTLKSLRLSSSPSWSTDLTVHASSSKVCFRFCKVKTIFKVILLILSDVYTEGAEATMGNIADASAWITDLAPTVPTVVVLFICSLKRKPVSLQNVFIKAVRINLTQFGPWKYGFLIFCVTKSEVHIKPLCCMHIKEWWLSGWKELS